MPKHELLLLKNMSQPGYTGSLADYERAGGYQALRKVLGKIATILKRYPEKRAALLPLLWLSQEEQGYLSEAAMKEIAGLLGLTPPQVYETVTFYTMLNRQPIGKYHIQACRSLMCALVGTEQLLGWIHATPARTSAGRRPPCWSPWKGSEACRASSRRSPPRTGCSSCRRW